MKRLQNVLLFAFVLLAALLVGQAAWTVLMPALTDAVAAVPSMLSAVPGWVWWTAFGVAMWGRCARRAAWRGGCRRHASRAVSTGSCHGMYL